MKEIYDLNFEQQTAVTRFFGQLTNDSTLTFEELVKDRVVYDLFVRQPMYSQFVLRQQEKEIRSESKNTQIDVETEIGSDISGFIEFIWESQGPLFRNFKGSVTEPLLIQLAFLMFIEILPSRYLPDLSISSKNDMVVPKTELSITPCLLHAFRNLIMDILKHVNSHFAASEKRAESLAQNYRSQIKTLSYNLEESDSLNAHFKELIDVSQAECEALRREIDAMKSEKDNILQSKLFKVQEIKLNETMIHDIVKDNYALNAENSQLRHNCRQLADENQKLSRELSMYQSQALMLSHYMRTKDRLEGQLEFNHHQFMLAQEKLKTNEEQMTKLQKLLRRTNAPEPVSEQKNAVDSQLVLCLVDELETYLRIIHDAGILIVDSELQITQVESD